MTSDDFGLPRNDSSVSGAPGRGLPSQTTELALARRALFLPPDGRFFSRTAVPSQCLQGFGAFPQSVPVRFGTA
jgi:hypothetical protein